MVTAAHMSIRENDNCSHLASKTVPEIVLFIQFPVTRVVSGRATFQNDFYLFNGLSLSKTELYENHRF